MVRMTAKRLRPLIEARRAEVQRADSARLPYEDHRFDKAYALHTLYFWSEPVQHVREVHRVLRPAGRFVLGFTPDDDPQARANFPATVYRFYSADQVRALLEQAGFADPRMIRKDISSRPIVFAVADR
jgi:SAM-dependent methyltransferase